MPLPDDRANTWVAWAILVPAAVILSPLAPVIMLAIWFGAFARVVHRPLTKALGGRRRLAAWLTVLALVAVLIPAVLVVTSLALEAYDLVVELAKSPRVKEVFEQLVQSR